VDVLDVGCGSGTLLGLLKHRGFRVTGLDFSAEAAAIAKAENGVDVAVGSLEEAHFPAESFDVVTLFHVMEHVTNPRQVLAEVSRVLKITDGVVRHLAVLRVKGGTTKAPAPVAAVSAPSDDAGGTSE